MQTTKESISNWLMTLQDNICAALEQADGLAVFKEDKWERQEGGGGRTRIIEEGAVIEKGGVNYSAVHGRVPSFLLNESQHSISENKVQTDDTFYATGVSIVIHPKSPMVPIIHMNVRYFEMSNGVKWLGGGIDLTPHYVKDEDARFFHQALKTVCDKHHPSYYKRFKTWADDYFFIRHRNETRGVGGIFFDRLYSTEEMSFEKNLDFWKDTGLAFAPVYVELITRNAKLPYGEKERNWQLIRRGRYVEFNLVYDKGTKFGLETNGRIESILMSLPKNASWVYDYTPEENSWESKTLSKLTRGIDWVN